MQPGTRETTAIGWVVAFTALVAHLPALAGYFARADWRRLALGSGLAVPDAPWMAPGDLVLWRLLWPGLGTEAAAYHGFALVLAVLLAVLTVLAGRRLGLGPVAIAVAGLWVAITPAVVRPVQWISTTPDLLAAGLAVASLAIWRGGRPAWAALPGLAALATAGIAWSLPLALLAARRPADAPSRIVLAALGAGGLTSLWAGWALDPGAGSGAKAWLAGATWFASPWPVVPPVLPVGATLWILWAVLARGSRPARVGLLLALGSVVTLWSGPGVSGAGWPLAAVGASLVLGPLVARILPARWAAAPALLVAAAVLALVGWMGTRSWLAARDADGIHRDAVVRDQAMAAESIRLLRQVPRTPGGQIGILQASRTPPPPDAPEDPDHVLPSPLLVALDGTLGPRVALGPDLQLSWHSHLEGLAPSTPVFLDDGGVRLVPLGRLANARMVSALIAVAAGQYERARHDLWSVVGGEGARIRYHHDPDALPITLEELRAGTPGFVEFLRAGTTPIDDHLLQLFEQLYEAVTGEALFRTPWGGMERG